MSISKHYYYVLVPAHADDNQSAIYEFKNYYTAYRFRQKYKYLKAVLIKYKNNYDLFANFVKTLGNPNQEANRGGVNNDQCANS